MFFNSGDFLELCVMPKDEDILQLVSSLYSFKNGIYLRLYHSFFNINTLLNIVSVVFSIARDLRAAPFQCVGAVVARCSQPRSHQSSLYSPLIEASAAFCPLKLLQIELQKRAFWSGAFHMHSYCNIMFISPIHFASMFSLASALK